MKGKHSEGQEILPGGLGFFGFTCLFFGGGWLFLEHGLIQPSWYKKQHLKSHNWASQPICVGPGSSNGCFKDLRPPGRVSKSDFSGDTGAKACAESTAGVQDRKRLQEGKPALTPGPTAMRGSGSD